MHRRALPGRTAHELSPRSTDHAFVGSECQSSYVGGTGYSVQRCFACSPHLLIRPVQARPPISDNSFLIEEAYNQEAGVVQHIFNYRRARDGEWLATFTQEWPLGGQLDQLSYTLPLQSAIGSGAAIGDAAINYPPQVLGHDDEPVWFAPRLSVVVPSGSARKGTGVGDRACR
jgi:hypothetical protein